MHYGFHFEIAKSPKSSVSESYWNFYKINEVLQNSTISSNSSNFNPTKLSSFSYTVNVHSYIDIQTEKDMPQAK